MLPKLPIILAALVALLVGASTAAAAPPANDDFEQAAPLVMPAVVQGVYAGATTQPGEPAHGSQTVWYAFTPAVSERVAVKVSDTPGTEAEIAVYTGATLATLQEVAHDRTYPARVAFDAVAGETYRIAVGNVNNNEAGTTFELRLDPAPLPPNDAFADATAIRVPSEHTGDLADATREAGEPESRAGSLWYKLRPRHTGKVTFDFRVTGYDCKIRLYTGRSLEDLELVKEGGSVTSEGPRESMTVKLRRGVLYHVAIGCELMEDSTFVLAVADGSVAGKGIAMAVKPGQTLARVRARGLRARVTAERRARVGIDLRVSRRTARRLDLGGRVLGSVERVVDGSRGRTAVIRLHSRARRALAGADALRAILRLEILRSDAPDRVLKVPVSL